MMEIWKKRQIVQELQKTTTSVSQLKHQLTALTRSGLNFIKKEILDVIFKYMYMGHDQHVHM